MDRTAPSPNGSVVSDKLREESGNAALFCILGVFRFGSLSGARRNSVIRSSFFLQLRLTMRLGGKPLAASLDSCEMEACDGFLE